MQELVQILNEIYEEIVFWKKNLYKLPSGAAGKNFVREMTRLIETWKEENDLAEISLKALMVMPALLLQKPTRKSNVKQHSQYLIKRLKSWLAGDFDELLREGRAIQNKLKQSSPKAKSPEQLAKTFSELMFQGKVPVVTGKVVDRLGDPRWPTRLLRRGEGLGNAAIHNLFKHGKPSLEINSI